MGTDQDIILAWTMPQTPKHYNLQFCPYVVCGHLGVVRGSLGVGATEVEQIRCQGHFNGRHYYDTQNSVWKWIDWPAPDQVFRVWDWDPKTP